MLSANSIATTLSASSCSVQLVCPSGASLHVMATRCASCLPSSFRLRPGRGLSLIAASSPSVTNRVRTLPTVLALSETASATSRSDSPWSAFNSASARFTVRANDLPQWATSFRSDRSDSVSSTLYLMAGISRQGLTKRLCTSLINFSYYINTLWKRY